MSVTQVPTPHGDGRATTHRARSPRAALLISHGAGADTTTRDVLALAEQLPRHGVTVVRFDQPWVVAGRRVATPPPTLDDGLRAASSRLRSRVPLVVGGRSAGARSAARCAAGLGAAGCLALSFPLHPPGRPEKSRLEELVGAGVPTLVVQGEADTFGRPEDFPADTTLCVVPGADHGMKVPKAGPITQDEALGVIVEATLDWLEGVVREATGESVRR